MAEYLFLDVDGVLNAYPHDEDSWGVIDEKNIKLFADFIHESPEVKIVLTSDWKRDFGPNLQPLEAYYKVMTDEGPKEVQSLAITLLDAFEKYDLKLYDKTPSAGRSTRYDWYWERTDEIKWYIEEHLTEDDEYVIVDDHDTCHGNVALSERFAGHYVRTKYTEGLRPKDIEKIKEILKIGD